jgi:hypothetical protein
VVVKGGNGYKVYRGNFPDMITANNNGGQPAGFSRWFVCYGPAAPPPQPHRHRQVGPAWDSRGPLSL